MRGGSSARSSARWPTATPIPGAGPDCIRQSSAESWETIPATLSGPWNKVQSRPAPYYAGVKCMGYANAERPCRDCWPGSARLDTCPALQRLPAVGLSRRAYDRLAGFSSSSGARGLATLPQVNGATPFSCGLWHLGCRHPHRLAFPPLPIRGSGGFPQANAWEPPSQGTEVAT